MPNSYELTKQSPMELVSSINTKKPSAQNPRNQFSKMYDFKQRTDARRLGAAKNNHKSIKKGTS